MSLQTWKEEYYKIPANEVSEEDAIEHSLNKWKGLTEENLKRHGLYKNSSTIRETPNFNEFDKCFEVIADTCALCKVYYKEVDDDYDDEDSEIHPCEDCPLYRVRRDVSCDDTQYDEKISPFNNFTSNNNPLPMIFWLEKAKEFVSKNG